MQTVRLKWALTIVDFDVFIVNFVVDEREAFVDAVIEGRDADEFRRASQAFEFFRFFLFLPHFMRW